MSEISNAEAALLALLSEEPMYPYKIEQEVKYRDMRFWTELSMSSIYKLLRKLERDGLVDCETGISEENRTRRTYSVTEYGANALRKKLGELLCEPEHLRWRVDIGTYNVDLIDPQEAVDRLKEYREGLRKNLQGYKDLEKFLIDSDCPTHRKAVARRPQYMLAGELSWVEEFINELEEKL